MALPTALLVKGLAGVGAVAAVIGGGVLINNSLKSKNSNKEINEKIKKLGIDESCLFTDNNTHATCTLNAEKLKEIKFEGKSGDTVTGLTGDKEINLVIEKGYEDFKKSDNSLYFPEGLRFLFKNTNTGTSDDVTVGDNGGQITFKAQTNYDYKIKRDGENLKLEKAWDLTTLNEMVGVNCTSSGGSSDNSQCDLTTGKVNVWSEDGNYITEATVAANSKIKVAKDQKDYKNGFKFTVESNINLTQADNSKKSGTLNQLTQTNKSYEINFKDIGGTKKWFLIEKSTAA